MQEYKRKIESFLPDKTDWKVIVLESVGSTNDYAKKLAMESDSDKIVVVSLSQTNGRGRMGRQFVSPKNSSIYMSILIREEISAEDCSLVTPFAAVAVAKAVDEVCKTDAKIKWVNDLFLGGKKICGILTEASFKGDKSGYIIIGIGLNVRSVKEIFSDELLKTATSIEDETGMSFSKSKIIAEILLNFEKIKEELSSKKFLGEYKRRSCIIGESVAVLKPYGEREAKAVDINDKAELLVEYENGETEALNSGEARILKK